MDKKSEEIKAAALALKELFKKRQNDDGKSFFLGEKEHLPFMEIIRQIGGSSHTDGLEQNDIGRALVGAVEAVFYVLDENLRMVGWNRRLEKVLKRTGDEIEGTYCIDHVAEADGNRSLEAIGRLVSGESEHVTVDSALRTSDGVEVPYLLQGTLLPVGDTWYVFGFAIDVSESRESHQRAEWYGRLQAELVQIAADILVVGVEKGEEGLGDAIGRICKIFGMNGGVICTEDEATGRMDCQAEWSNQGWSFMPKMERFSYAEFLSTLGPFDFRETICVDDIEGLSEEYDLLKNTLRTFLLIRSFVFFPLKKKGRMFGFFAVAGVEPEEWTEQYIEPLKIVGQLIANAMIRIDQERRLIEREMELEATLEANKNGILVLDGDQKTILSNSQFAEIWGLSEPPSRGHSLDYLKESFSELLSPEIVEAMCGGRAGGEVRRVEEKWDLSDGRLLSVSRRPLSWKGQSRGSVCTFRDITEKRKLEIQLQQAQKLESVGRLASGVAHDFNNILFGISAICDVRLLKNAGNDTDRKDIEEIKMETERAAALTRQLLAFSRKQVLSIRTIEINEVIRSMGTMLPRLLGEDIDLRFMLEAKPGKRGRMLTRLSRLS